MKVTNPILSKKLVEQELKYLRVQQFSELLPDYAQTIVQNEFDGSRYCCLTHNHGKLPLPWGVCWSTNTPTNYPEDLHKQVGFINVYINCISLFGEGKGYVFSSNSLRELIPKIKCHFYDHLNSNFYFLPSEAKQGLDILEQWYLETKASCQVYLKEQRRTELEKELAAL